MKGKIDRTRMLVVVGAALVVLVAGATWAWAQTDGVINACVSASDGTLRIVAEPVCKNKEVLLTWNIMGPKGDPGLACWDLNGDGIQDAAEDINADGAWNALDCQGEPGQDGAAGGAGLACWDLNGDGIQDAAEDTNGDGAWNALDCKGADGADGTNGLACWDLNGDGAADPGEDVNGDTVVDVLDCQGPQGPAGVVPRLGFSLITVDSTGDVGSDENSIAIGADGLPVMSYYDLTNRDLKVAHCEDLACTSRTVVTVASEGNVGTWHSIAIGADGLPVISYSGDYDTGLKVVHCDDPACASSTVATLDLSSEGPYNSIAVGADGLPVVSYLDNPDVTNGHLKVAHCGDATCASSTLAMVDSGYDVGYDTCMAIGADGLPVISYRDGATQDLKLAHCSNRACTAATLNTLDSAGDVGRVSSIAIGTDGLPVVSYLDFTNYDLKVAHCNDLTCASSTVTTLDSAGRKGWYSSIAIGADGLPVISYVNSTYDDDLNVAHCSNRECTAATFAAVDWPGWVGRYSSIAIGADGLPVISYYDATNDDLKVAHCSNAFCVPYLWP